jgi:hypothetical protein
VSVLSHDSERSCICVSGIDFTEVSTILLLCFVAALMAWWLSWRGGSHGVVALMAWYCIFHFIVFSSISLLSITITQMITLTHLLNPIHVIYWFG